MLVFFFKDSVWHLHTLMEKIHMFIQNICKNLNHLFISIWCHMSPSENQLVVPVGWHSYSKWNHDPSFWLLIPFVDKYDFSLLFFVIVFLRRIYFNRPTKIRTQDEDACQSATSDTKHIFVILLFVGGKRLYISILLIFKSENNIKTIFASNLFMYAAHGLVKQEWNHVHNRIADARRLYINARMCQLQSIEQSIFHACRAV